ncbi:MAG TPA: phage holin family protein [Candidatus Cybelea sp.]|jgi:hypothetical protein|nr:phage holin family protein [Candidatus Cybelea sp.]
MKDAPAEPLKQLVGDITVLIRDELAIARQEMVEKAKSAGMGAGMLSGSALAGFFTLASGSVLVALLLGLVLPMWSAVLVVTILWAAATAALALAGRKKIGEAAPFVPEQTIADLKEDLGRVRRRRSQR